jgi:hypothetical protein
MLLQILSRTPPWVFALFVVLVLFGILQSRSRQLGLARVALLPLVLIGLSLSGLWSTFGANAFAIASWLAAVAAAVLLNRLAKWPRQIAYEPATRSFRVAGSWIPLAVMMLIFFTRYAVAVGLAVQPALAQSPWLAPGVAFAYGLMSGAFLARALRILGAARPAAVPA